MNNNNNEELNSSFKGMSTNNNSITNNNNIENSRYPKIPNFNNAHVVEMNRHQDMCYYLRQIAENTRPNRRNAEDHGFMNFAVILVVVFAIAFMVLRYGQEDGFSYPVCNKLLAMILILLVFAILLHREDANIIKKVKESGNDK